MALVVMLTCVDVMGAKRGGLEHVRLQLKWRHQFQFAGYYAAVAQGYYREVGLDVEILESKPGMYAVNEVLAGKAEYGVELPSMFIERMKGKPVVVLAAVFQHSPLVLITKKGTGVLTPQDLVGRRVMARLKSEAQLQAMFLNEGINLKRIKFIEHTFDFNDLAEDRVDALSTYTTDSTHLSIQDLNEVHMIRPITYGIDFYGDCLFTSEAEIASHPERVRAFRAASLRGWEYALAHPEEVIAYIKENYKTQATRQTMLYEAKVIQEELMLSKLVQVGHMNPGRWKHIADTFVRLGMMDAGYELDGFLYDPNPASVWRTRLMYGGLIGLTAMLFGLIVLFGFNRRLRWAVEERTKALAKTNLQLIMEASERQTAVERLKLLMAEMDHRVKNNLASVISLAQQSLQNTSSLVEFEDAFTGRVESMSKAHELLSSHQWEGVELEEIIRSVVMLFSESGNKRVRFKGEKMMLVSRLANPLSLVLHELATNAMKHGSLSNEVGEVLISWWVDDEGVLFIRWEEKGGPEVSVPEKTSTGTDLIKGFIEYELMGHVETTYRPEGLVCELSMPSKGIVELADEVNA